MGWLARLRWAIRAADSLQFRLSGEVPWAERVEEANPSLVRPQSASYACVRENLARARMAWGWYESLNRVSVPGVAGSSSATERASSLALAGL